jgi:hypothetical protein
MTRKDYVIIAEALRVTYHNARIDWKNAQGNGNAGHCDAACRSILQTTDEIADSLQRDNARFNREHFLAVVRGEKALLSRPARGAK